MKIFLLAYFLLGMASQRLIDTYDGNVLSPMAPGGFISSKGCITLPGRKGTNGAGDGGSVTVCNGGFGVPGEGGK